MATQYSTILKLALPTQGELSGTWGDVVNNNITSMVEEAIAGRAVINTWSTNSHTLTTANGTTSESRCAMLEFTDTGTALSGAGTVICPTASKIYICKNDAGQTVTIKTSAGTGVAIADGETKFVFCDGTNVVEAVTSIETLSTADLTATTADINGGTIDGTVIGGSSAAAGSFTTITASGEITANGGIALGDNDKATFGASDDLQIYHDGTRNYIDSNTTELRLQTSELRMVNSANTEIGLKAVEDGAVTLYYDAASRLSTTSTGVDVTGTVTADGLTVDGGSGGVTFNGSSDIVSIVQSSAGSPAYIHLDNTIESGGKLWRVGSTGGVAGVGTNFGILNQTDNTNIVNFASNGDISFYEDTGTTAKFYWDASAESLGIGTTTVSALLHLRDGSTEDVSGSKIRMDLSGINPYWELQARNGGSAANRQLGFYTSATSGDVLTLTQAGNVGIGTTSPATPLHVKTNTTTNVGFFDYVGAATICGITDIGGSAELRVAGQVVSFTGAGGAGTEHMRITSSGDLLVGKTTTDFGVVGTIVEAGGNLGITRTSAAALNVNRLSTDGDIAKFYKDGTTVGSIGNLATSMYISGSTSQAGLLFNGTSYEPTTNGSTRVDNSITIGSGSYRYKNLYLSGGVYLGGTGAANLLDDYEEGTWTPVSGAGDLSGTGLSYTGTYTKVGNLVTVHLAVTTTANDALVSSYQFWSGLPFTAAKSGTGTVITEDIDQFSRQGFAAVTGTSFQVSACGSATGTTRLDAIVTYIVA